MLDRACGSPGPNIAQRWQTPTVPARRWLILADRGGIGQQLAERLRVERRSLRSGICPGPAQIESSAEAKSLDPKSPEDTGELLSTPHALGDRRALHGVIYLWPLDAAPFDALDADFRWKTKCESWCGGALHLVQALARHTVDEAAQIVAYAPAVPRKWIPPTNGCRRLAATVWGLGKVIALEHPELRCARIDLDPNGG